MRRAWFAQVQTPNNDNGRSNCNRMIKHFQHFGINIDEGFPEADEDGKYPNDDQDTDTNSPDEIDEMITDEDVDPDSLEPDDDDEGLCESDEE
jgi:hypothetical protein